MEESVRLQYLEAMGIDVWVPRHPPIAQQTVINPVAWASQSEAHLDGISELQQTLIPKQSSSDPLLARPLNAVRPELAEGLSRNGMPVINRTGLITGDQPHDSRLSEARQTDIPTANAAFPPLAHHAKPHTDDHAWKDLQHEVSICRACSLCETRTQTVFGVGNKHATWMLIGEAPGRDEDLQGEPFVGRAGQLLNEMIRAIGLTREQVYIANMLKCRPPNNRDPQADEVAACHDFLKRQIVLIQPKIIVAVGRIAAQNLLKTQQPLSRLRGIQHQLEGVPLTVVHHPAYLLRSLPEKAKAWEDLQFALTVYQSLEQ